MATAASVETRSLLGWPLSLFMMLIQSSSGAADGRRPRGARRSPAVRSANRWPSHMDIFASTTLGVGRSCDVINEVVGQEVVLTRIENARVQSGSEQTLQHGGQSSRTALGVAGLDMFSGTNSIAAGYVVCRARSPHSRCSSSLASPGQFIVRLRRTMWAGPMTTSGRPQEPQWDGSRVGPSCSRQQCAARLSAPRTEEGPSLRQE